MDFGKENGAKLAPKWGLKSMSKSIKKRMPFKIGFWTDVDGFWEGKWSQVGTKMGLKVDLILNKVKNRKLL